MKPTLRQLEYLVAVADHLHFRRAARACNVTQPALSAQIQQLEANLGVRLFERSQRRVLITPVGVRIVERARAILRDLDDLSDVARGARDALAGDLWLGVIPTIAPYLLPDIVAAARARYPKLSLLLKEDQTQRLVDDLQRGDLDLLFVALPVEGAGLHARKLRAESFVLAVPRSSPLARGDRPLPQSVLDGEQVLLLEDGH